MFLIIGAGSIAVEYFNVLTELAVDLAVIGRGDASAENFFKRTGEVVIRKSIDDFLMSNNEMIEGAVVAVNVESLYNVVHDCIRLGIKKILVEKPGALTSTLVRNLSAYAESKGASVYIAYNRRNFSSTIEAKKLIEQDGGVNSFRFEITEWGHQISRLERDPLVLNNWFLANTSHVVDLAFYLGGRPKVLDAYCSQPTDWHPSGTNFSGAGVSENGALFAYYGNWLSPGRWGVEIQTKNYKFILCPLETLKIQRIGSILVEDVPLDNQLDSKFKPGFFEQVRHFITDDCINLCSLSEHISNCEWYDKIAGYTN